ncbi:hypothetical protein C6988_00890 [Nitrosopumilus sp. b1]|uniref:GNAT family N-acetyltransferase n=1 Tax=Nitrosopumilus sp. b1 TaxID=2109907 RepID=UPI0015F53EA0|nr:GNAT family protein [Nitrosopumilus sp. b1]KAF6243997.1 hypothetical protein C6988_00890 [Nitrosopumilus sp. b1]
MNESTEKFFFKNKNYFLRKTSTNDHPFIYNLVKEFLETDLSVTVLTLISFEEFFKKKINRYTISNDQNDLIGFVQILENNEIGYFLDKKFRNKGIGTEAVSLLMKLNPKERYFATVNNKNKPSKKLIERLGFYPKATIYEKIVNS